MCRLMMFSALVALCVVQGAVTMVAARSGGPATEDRWNPRHVNDLPPEVRGGVIAHAAGCDRPLAAEHGFVLYFNSGGTKLIGVHFEHLRCGNRNAICTAAGCLHQVYVSAGGTYRLLQSAHVPELDLTHIRIPH